MTLIVNPKLFSSKAALKENLDKSCLLEDPSIVAPWARQSMALPVGFSDVVTNHPLRTKFAKITKRADGSWEVK